MDGAWILSWREYGFKTDGSGLWGQQAEMIFSEGNESVRLHFTELLGKCRPVQIQKISQLLPVEGNIKFAAVLLQGNMSQVSDNLLTHRF